MELSFFGCGLRTALFLSCRMPRVFRAMKAMILRRHRPIAKNPLELTNVRTPEPGRGSVIPISMSAKAISRAVSCPSFPATKSSASLTRSARGRRTGMQGEMPSRPPRVKGKFSLAGGETAFRPAIKLASRTARTRARFAGRSATASALHGCIARAGSAASACAAARTFARMRNSRDTP